MSDLALFGFRAKTHGRCQLGDMSAPKLLERLREQGRQLPFIIVTGHGDERTAVEMMQHGALDYVMKDAGMLELLPGIVQCALTVVERERKLTEAKEAIRRREEARARAGADRCGTVCVSCGSRFRAAS